MNKKSVFFASFPLLLASLSSCSSHYQLSGVERTRIVVDKRFDAQPDAKAVAFLAPYKHQVDSVLGPVLGTVAHDMAATLILVFQKHLLSASFLPATEYEISVNN